MTVHPVVPALWTAYVIAAEPKADASADGVTGEAVASIESVGDQVTVCVASETVKLTLDAVADACVVLAAMLAARVQVPDVTKATTPVEELIVHTEVVELEYVFVPVPADAVEVIVGGVAVAA